MAWYAELKRREWWCIRGMDMVSWYSDMLYAQWWESLTDEERQRIIDQREKRRKREWEDAMRPLAQLMYTSALLAGHRTEYAKSVTKAATGRIMELMKAMDEK